MENNNTKIKVGTSFMGYNKKQTDFEFDKLQNRIKVLEGDVRCLKNIKNCKNKK